MRSSSKNGKLIRINSQAGKKALYVGLGLVATCLGVVGVWVPGLPTVSFILVALWAFSRSSPRLYRWVRQVPLLKNAIEEAEQFRKTSSLSLRTKLVSQASAWTSFFVVFYVFRSSNWLVVVLVGVAALACTVFMISVPTIPKKTASNAMENSYE